MAKRHGNKMHHQVLLDIHRSQLLEEHAAATGVKTAALLRTIVYRYLKTTLGDQYEAAELADEGFYKLTPIQKKRSERTLHDEFAPIPTADHLQLKREMSQAKAKLERNDEHDPTPEEVLRAFVNQLETKSR